LENYSRTLPEYFQQFKINTKKNKEDLYGSNCSCKFIRIEEGAPRDYFRVPKRKQI
jgi:hypothetical protein